MRRILLSLAVLMSVVACGGGGDGGTNPPPPPSVASVVVTLSSTQLLPGGSAAASAELRSASGAVLSGRAITWMSSAPTVAAVDATGRVNALAPGLATITALSEGVSGSASLTVVAPVASVVITGASRVKVGDTYAYSVTPRLSDGTIVTRPVTWSIVESGRATIQQDGTVTATQVGAFTIQATIDGVPWTTSNTAYDWEVLSSGGNQFVSVLADSPILNRAGTSNYPELVISCGTSGFFFVWVRTPHVITASGLVGLAFDNTGAFAQTWDELSPSYNTLWKPGSNGVIKSFAQTIANARIFGFAFGEFQGTTKSTAFRVSGLAARLAPLTSQCNGNLMAGEPQSLNSIMLAFQHTRTDSTSAEGASLTSQQRERALAAPSTQGITVPDAALRGAPIDRRGMKRGG